MQYNLGRLVISPTQNVVIPQLSCLAYQYILQLVPIVKETSNSLGLTTVMIPGYL